MAKENQAQVAGSGQLTELEEFSDILKQTIKPRTEVAAKTGTSQVFVNGVKKNNGFLITFAPYDNPEISVASVVELAGSGTSTAEITSSIIKYWYQNNTDEKTNQKTGTLLN